MTNNNASANPREHLGTTPAKAVASASAAPETTNATDTQDTQQDVQQDAQDAQDAPESQDNTGLPKEYNAKDVESRWYTAWEKAGVFTADVQNVLSGKKKPYVVMMPPPNVTGTLHNGHALFITLQDVLVRYHRMKNYEALWLPGVDHAGIATQAVVERELKKYENKTRHDLGRDAFLERVWQWKEKHGARIVEQLRTMGASADWTRERFTMDETCSRAVREAFVKMWNDGLIYRGERLVNWDPATQTALSDEEVESEERQGELWRFAYKVKEDGQTLIAKSYTCKQPAQNAQNTANTTSAAQQTTQTTLLPADTDAFADGNFAGGAPDVSKLAAEIVVATTRPETMLGDVAVAVHPDDERYQHLIGKQLIHPFCPDRVLTVVADNMAEKDKGTGAVKITPAHDPNDFALGQRLGLPTINIMNLDGSINGVGGVFAGMDRFDARNAVKAALIELGLYRGTEKIKHQIPVSQRSGAVVEPLLSRQYFVKSKPLADLALAAVESGETRIIPSFWTKTWDHFMRNIRDWCISRQLWWGHRIPVFYDLQKLPLAVAEHTQRHGPNDAQRAIDAGKTGKALLDVVLPTLDDDLIKQISVASVDDLRKQNPEQYWQEEDVLDTWFSAGLWPFATLGWPDNTDDLKAFYPGAVLETGWDILFFWVARMMMMGTYFLGKAPFSDVYLHSLVRDAQGQKMSKSLGNAIDPLDVINGISLQALLKKTKTYPIPSQNLNKVLKGLEREYPEGIPTTGADGLRFTLAALLSQGRDVRLSLSRAQGYRAFLNKIWNATRFALMRLGDAPVLPLSEVKTHFSVADRWILSRLQQTTKRVTEALDTYRFDDAANALYAFFWTEYCDSYVELSKVTLNAPPAGAFDGAKEALRSTMLTVLETTMRLMHPLCPFQSEEIWQTLKGRYASYFAGNGEKPADFCARAAWPQYNESLIDADAEKRIQCVLNAISMSRNARQESGLPPQKKLDGFILTDDDTVMETLQYYQRDIVRLASLSNLSFYKRGAYQIPRLAAVNADADLEIVLPLEGLLDVEAEKARLSKEIEKAKKEAASLQGRLQNADFRNRADPEVINETERNCTALTEKIARFSSALQRLLGA